MRARSPSVRPRESSCTDQIHIHWIGRKSGHRFARHSGFCRECARSKGEKRDVSMGCTASQQKPVTEEPKQDARDGAKVRQGWIMSFIAHVMIEGPIHEFICIKLDPNICSCIHLERDCVQSLGMTSMIWREEELYCIHWTWDFSFAQRHVVSSLLVTEKETVRIKIMVQEIFATFKAHRSCIHCILPCACQKALLPASIPAWCPCNIHDYWASFWLACRSIPRILSFLPCPI